jgi:hypothetical protein
MRENSSRQDYPKKEMESRIESLAALLHFDQDLIRAMLLGELRKKPPVAKSAHQ